MLKPGATAPSRRNVLGPLIVGASPVDRVGGVETSRRLTRRPISVVGAERSAVAGAEPLDAAAAAGPAAVIWMAGASWGREAGVVACGLDQPLGLAVVQAR